MARSLTTRSTNPKIMDDNIKILDDNLGKASAPDAEDVVYDNTDSGLTADDVQAAIDEIVDQLNGQSVSGVSLTLNENVNFNIDNINVKRVGNLAIIYLRLQTTASITGSTEIEIGTFSGIEYVGHIAGAIASNTNSSLLGAFVVTSDNKLYINFTGNVSNNTVVDLTLPCFILNS